MEPQQTPFKALSRVKRPCHGEVLSLNLLDDCPAGCLHCRHGRGKIKRDLTTPENLVPNLIREIEWRRRRGGTPAFVTVGANGEPFPKSSRLRAVTMECLEALLKRRIGVSLETRGAMPDEALELLSRHRQLVRVRVALLSMDPKLIETWEPGTADPGARLFNLQRLRRATVPSILLLAPVIPFVNDSKAQLRPVLDAAQDVGVRRVSVEVLRLWPGARTVLEEKASGLSSLVLSAYLDRSVQPPPPRQTIPVEARHRIYEQLSDWASRRRVNLSVCKCNDPQLGNLPCSLGFGTARRPVKQMGLFPGAEGDAQATSRKSSPSVQPDFDATARSRSRTRNDV